MATYEEIMGQEVSRETNLPSYQELSGEQPVETQPIKETVEDDFPAYEYIANKAKEGVAGLLAMPGGIPVDVLQGLLDLGPYLFNEEPMKVNPYGMQGQKEAFMTMLFGESGQETKNDMLRYAGSAAEFLGAGLLPGTAIVAKSPTMISKLYNALLEGTSAVVGGVALEGGGDIAASINEDYRGTGEVVGGVVGTMAPYAAPTAMAPVYGRLRAFFDPAIQKQIGKQSAARIIQEELAKTPDAMINLEKSERLRDNIPGYTPSLGMETNAVGIQTLEKRFAESSQEGFTKAMQAEQKSLKAIQRKSNEMFPNTGFDITSLPRKNLVAVRHKIKKESHQLDLKMKEVESQINTGNPEKIGQELRRLRGERYALARMEKNSLYEDFYRSAEDMGVTVETKSIQDLAKQIISEEGITFQDKSPVLKEIIRKYVNTTPSKDVAKIPNVVTLEAAPNDISMREFHSMMKKVNREYWQAYKSEAKDPSLIYQLQQMKAFFAKNLDDIKKPEFGGVAEKLKEADKYYINEYQKVFKEGVGGRMAATNKYGDVTPDEKVVSDLVMGRASGIDDFRKIYGDNAESQALLENGIVDMFARKVMKNGIYDSKQATKFLYDNKLSLDKIPALRDALGNKVKAYKLAVDRQKLLHEKRKALQNNKLKELTGLRRPEYLIEEAMSTTQSLGVLRNNISKHGEEGLKAFRHGVANYIMKQKDPFDYFLQNEEKMKIAFKGEDAHFNTLKDLAEAKRNLSRKFGTKQIESSLRPKDPLEPRGTTTREVTTLARHVYSGWISPSYAASHLTSKALFKYRQDELNKMIEEAFYDPDIAKMLMDGVGAVKLDSEKYMFKIRERMYSIGAKSNIAAQATDDEFEE